MDKQKIFDRVYRAIVQQGRPSLDKHSLIAYRGDNGDKCAIGHLLPDNVYNPYMENLNVSAIMGTEDPDVEGVRNYLKANVGERSFLQDLQNAHDKAARVYVDLGAKRPSLFMSIFYANMKKVAKRHELKKNYY